MSNNKDSLDGFIPRRPGNRLGEMHQVKNPNAAIKPIDRTLHSRANVSTDRVGVPRAGKQMGMSDLEDSLRQIDAESPQDGGKKSRRQRRKDKKADKKPIGKVRRIIKWTVIAILVALVALVGYLVVKGINASGNVLQGSIFDIVQHQPLKEDKNGRSNFLLLGTSEDDPGHDAGYLTDSIMVLSIDQKNNNAYTFSIPRDLYVEYGQACASGYRGKINVYFSCVNAGKDAAAEQDRLTKTRGFIGEITGMDIQYAAHVNYTVMRDVVDAIGGSIQVNIEGNSGTGQRPDLGIMDANFDWKCGATLAKRKATCPPDGHFIDFEPGIQTLNSEQALYLAQARGDAANIGLAQSNFDRERNQQKILVAIRDKAMSAGTLTNLGKVTGLIDALGDNLRTNVETKEVRTLMDLGQKINGDAIKSIDLYTAENPIFTTGTIPGAGSSVYPKAGVGVYTGLQEYLQKQLTSNPIVQEGAKITVLNGSGVAGVGQTFADTLTAKEFSIDDVANAPEGTYDAVVIYQIGTGNTATAAKLKELYGVTIKTTAPPVSVTGDTDFVIIVGKAPTTTQ